MISYGNGGAFPEFHFLQFPNDIGKRVVSIPQRRGTEVSSAGPQGVPVSSSGITVCGGGSSAALVVHQTAGTALDTKHFALTALQKPAEEEVAASLAATQRMVDERLKELGHGKSKGDEVVDPHVDPFARKMVAKQPKTAPLGQLTIVAADAASDPSAVIRSPTKKRTAADEALASVPMCISGWKNPKNLVIPLEMRQEADTTNRDKPTMSSAHIKLAQALQEKQKEQEQARLERERAEREENDRRQAALEAEAAAKALEQLAHHRAEQLRLAKNETREERQERRRLEREQRQREREEEHRQRRLRVAAERIGTTVEELEGNHALMDALNDAQGGGKQNHGGNAHVDSRLHNMKPTGDDEGGEDGSGGLSGGVGMVVNDVALLSSSRIADEMKRLADPKYVQPEGVRPPGDEAKDDDDDDDDDAFGIGELLKRSGKRPRE